jgi:hypothetical protein
MGTDFLLKEKSRFSGTLRLEKIIISVLSGLNDISLPFFLPYYCEISRGVPQDSVLGPLLFIIYINVIADKFISLSRLFTDDTSLGYSNHDRMQLKSVMPNFIKCLRKVTKYKSICFLLFQ